VKSTTSAHRALAHLDAVAVPRQLFRTRSSTGMSWNLITVDQLVAGARTSQLLKRSRPPHVVRANSSSQLSALSADYLICELAALASSAANPDKGSSFAISTNLSKITTSANSVAMAALAQQMNAQYQAQQAQQQAQDALKAAQIAALIIAIAGLIALIKHQLMIFDFAGAIIIGLILIDLQNQLTKLLE
jgi:hypothetical protein